MNIVLLIVVGALAGLLVKVFDRSGESSWFGAMLCGAAGSVSAGAILSVVEGDELIAAFTLRTFLVAVVGAAIVLAAYVVVSARRSRQEQAHNGGRQSTR